MFHIPLAILILSKTCAFPVIVAQNNMKSIFSNIFWGWKNVQRYNNVLEKTIIDSVVDKYLFRFRQL